MSKILLALLAIVAVSQALNGQFALTFIPGAGYVVPVDFGSSKVRNLVVGLHHSKTVLTENCLQFDHFACDGVCNKNPFNTNPVIVKYPHFTATARVVNTIHAELDHVWSLKAASAVVAGTCSTFVTESTGAGASGVLGLGFNAESRNNFKSTNSFSVFFNQGFKLVFNPVMTFNKNLISQFRTNSAWRIPNVAAIGLGTLRNPLSGVSAIFDINTDTIGLPAALYNTFVGALNSRFNTQCDTSVLNQPTCLYAGDINTLPTVTIETGTGTPIIITPTMYAIKPQPGASFTLDARSLSATSAGVNYVTADFANTIILGNTILGNYYAYFNLADSTVSLYHVL